MKHKCIDCIIGLLYDVDDSKLTTLAGLEYHIKDQIEFNAYAIEIGSDMRRKIHTLSDYGDRRKSTDMRRFEYCPDCGKKIDWKKIRKGAKEE